MIPATLLTSSLLALRLRLHGDSGGGGARAKAALGQALLARVTARLAEGEFAVAVGGRLVRMALPATTQVGDTLKLALVNDSPQLTFALAAQASEAEAVLSEAGRFAAALAAPAHDTPPPRAAPLTTEPTDAKQLASALRDAIEHSGLFYESHQAQWVAGARSLRRLLLEPQARLVSPAASAGTAAPLATEQPPVPGSRGVAAQPGSDAPQQAAPATSARAAASHGVDPHALPYVQQQLAALDARQLLWHGQLWLGQPLEWRIEERPPEARTPADPASWHTTLRLALPQLGEVSANLALEPHGRLRVTLYVARNSSVATLHDRADALELAMASAGIALCAFSVTQHGSA